MKKIILVTITLLSTNLIFAQTSNSNSVDQARKARTEAIDKENAQKLEAQKLAEIQKQQAVKTNSNDVTLGDDGKPMENAPVPMRVERKKQERPDTNPTPVAPRRK